MPATIGGTPDNCLLEDVDERWRCREVDIESDKAAFESRIRWKRANAAEVAVGFRGPGSSAVELDVFIKSFLESSIFKKSEMFSSSAWMDSALVPVASARTPEPGWTLEDAALVLPLEWSSSSLFVPPEDGRPRRWLKELLYLDIGAGLGEAEFEDEMACSETRAAGRRAEAATEGGGIILESIDVPVDGRIGPVRGDTPRGVSTRAGDADRDGALNG